jgi:hypothetical protein
MEARDILIMAVLLFVVGIGIFVSFFMNTTFTRELRTVSQINSTPEAMTALDSTDRALNLSDYLYFSVFVGFCLFIIISGWFIGGHPIFMIFYIIFIIVSVILGAIFANTWETISAEPTFALTTSSFPLLNNIMAHLPMYLAIMGFISIVVVFAKPTTQGWGAQ